MSRRYAVLPSDLKNLSINDFQFNMFIMNKGRMMEERLAKRQTQGRQYQRKGKR